MKKILAVLIFLGFAGCATTGLRVDQGHVAKIKIGATTQSEVLKIFGPPDEMFLNQDGDEVFTYADIQARNSAWNYVPVFSFIHSEMKLTNEVLTIIFKNDVVKDYTVSSDKTPQKLKYGLLS